MHNHFILLLLAILGVFVALPFVAPVLMHIGLTDTGQALYQLYSLFCHQFPQRSYFLFGSALSYEMDTIEAALGHTSSGWALRQFIGNDALGWKVAWSDRMISLYGGLWLWATMWVVNRPARLRLRWPTMLVLTLPIVIDGGTHAISDIVYGIGYGFRDHNQWLSAFLPDHLSPLRYAGDSLGTVNSTLRIVTGLLFSFGLVNSVFPLLIRETQPTQAGYYEE